MGKKGFKGIMLLLVVSCLFLIGGAGLAADVPIKIGITQIVDHPALNAVRDGLIDALEEEYGYVQGKDIVYDLQNAQGDMATANIIAQKFIGEKVNLVFSIATPTSQSAVNAIRDIPIVFSAVTDPLAAGLVRSLEMSGNNVTGISDLTPVQRQFELIKFILPEAKNIGTLYNSGEINSITTNNLALQACEKFGWNLIEATVSTSADVALAIRSIIDRVDVIYVSTDNTIVSALDAVIQVTNENNIPLILADPTTLQKGALVALGFNYYQHGRQAAEIVARVLQGEKPTDIPVQFAKNLELALNPQTALEIDLPLANLLTSLSEFAEYLQEEGAKLEMVSFGQ